MTTKFDAIEPKTTEEDIRPVDYYQEEWELKRIEEISSDPESLADTLFLATSEDFDLYTSALSQVLMNADSEELPHHADQLRKVVEDIIVTDINKHNGYLKHLDALEPAEPTLCQYIKGLFK